MIFVLIVIIFGIPALSIALLARSDRRDTERATRDRCWRDLDDINTPLWVGQPGRGGVPLFSQISFDPPAELAPIVDWALQAFNEMAHQIGDATGHWLQGHHQECEVCLRSAAEREEAVSKLESEQRAAEFLSHEPLPGHEFPGGVEIIERSTGGEILVRWNEPPRHVESLCLTCHERQHQELAQSIIKLNDINLQPAID